MNMLIRRNTIKWIGIAAFIIILIVLSMIVPTLSYVDKEFSETLAPGERFSKKSPEYLEDEYINFKFKILNFNNNTIQFWLEDKDGTIFNKQIIKDDLTHEFWFLVQKEGSYSLFWENIDNNSLRISIKYTEYIENVFLDITMVLIVILLIGTIVFAVITHIKDRKKNGAKYYRRKYILLGSFITMIIFFVITFAFSIGISNVELQKNVVLSPNQVHKETIKDIGSEISVDYNWHVKAQTTNTIDFWIEDENGFKYDSYTLANGEGRSSEFVTPQNGSYTFIWKSNSPANATINLKLIYNSNQNMFNMLPVCLVFVVPIIIILIILLLYYIKSIVYKILAVMLILISIVIILFPIFLGMNPGMTEYDNILNSGDEISISPGESYVKSYNDITHNDYVSYEWLIKDCDNDTIHFWIQGETGIKYYDSLGNESETAFYGEFNPPHDGDYKFIWMNSNSNTSATIITDTSKYSISSGVDICCVIILIPIIIMFVMIYILIVRRKKTHAVIDEGVVYHKPEYYNPFFYQQLKVAPTSAQPITQPIKINEYQALYDMPKVAIKPQLKIHLLPKILYRPKEAFIALYPTTTWKYGVLIALIFSIFSIIIGLINSRLYFSLLMTNGYYTGDTIYSVGLVTVTLSTVLFSLSSTIGEGWFAAAFSKRQYHGRGDVDKTIGLYGYSVGIISFIITVVMFFVLLIMFSTNMISADALKELGEGNDGDSILSNALTEIFKVLMIIMIFGIIRIVIELKIKSNAVSVANNVSLKDGLTIALLAKVIMGIIMFGFYSVLFLFI